MQQNAQSRGKTFKLIVKVSDNCIEILRYVDKNIPILKQLGARVQVEKISNEEFDEEMVNILKSKGITRLPAVITPDGNLLIGLKSIIDMFEKNLTNARNRARVGGVGGVGGNNINPQSLNAEMGSNPDLNAFWMNELYAGINKNGNETARIPREG